MRRTPDQWFRLGRDARCDPSAMGQGKCVVGRGGGIREPGEGRQGRLKVLSGEARTLRDTAVTERDPANLSNQKLVPGQRHRPSASSQLLNTKKSSTSITSCIMSHSNYLG